MSGPITVAWQPTWDGQRRAWRMQRRRAGFRLVRWGGRSLVVAVLCLAAAVSSPDLSQLCVALLAVAVATWLLAIRGPGTVWRTSAVMVEAQQATFGPQGVELVNSHGYSRWTWAQLEGVVELPGLLVLEVAGLRELPTLVVPIPAVDRAHLDGLRELLRANLRYEVR